MVPFAFVATNLRLSDDLAGALRKEASRRGKSQQDIVREAIAKELGMASESTPMDRAVRAGTVEAPEPFSGQRADPDPAARHELVGPA